MNEEQENALFEWMKEVTAVLCFQPYIPQTHKEQICEKLDSFQQVTNAFKRYRK